MLEGTPGSKQSKWPNGSLGGRESNSISSRRNSESASPDTSFVHQPISHRIHPIPVGESSRRLPDVQARRELLYVGKSVHVGSRVLSYLRAPKGEKAFELIREAARIEWEYVPNEFYSPIHEMKLMQE